MVYVTQTYQAFQLVNGTDLVMNTGAADAGGVIFQVDGATGNVTLVGSLLANGATITPTELSRLDGVTANIQTQIDARTTVTDLNNAIALKADVAGETFTGDVVASAGLHHTGGTWGFNGNSVTGKQADPTDITSGTIDATYGATEAAVLEDLRTNVNDLKTMLRNIGILSA
jgi:hypothetical protein